MNTIFRHATPTPRMSRVWSGAKDSPHAPYFQRWLDHQAARHRELLLTIEAAVRISRGLVPTRREG